MLRDMQACVARRFAKAWDEVGLCIRTRGSWVKRMTIGRSYLTNKKQSKLHSDQSRLDAFFASYAIKPGFH